MAHAVIYEGVVSGAQSQPPADSLFAGQKLWFSQTVPQRKWFIQNAEANGAIIVALDKQADIVLVDHTKKNLPPGSHSYKYVEQSIRNGKLERLNDHIAGSASRADRPVGSVQTAVKSGRAAYTESEDQLLWDWVKPFMEGGGAWKGNEIYKQLESHNPRHTYQSWRDRWLKYTQYQDRQIKSRIGPAAEYDELYEAVDNSPQPPENSQPAHVETQPSSKGNTKSKPRPGKVAVSSSVSQVEKPTEQHRLVQVDSHLQTSNHEPHPRANSSAVRAGRSNGMGNEQSTPTSKIGNSQNDPGSLHPKSQEQEERTIHKEKDTDQQYQETRVQVEAKIKGSIDNNKKVERNAVHEAESDEGHNKNDENEDEESSSEGDDEGNEEIDDEGSMPGDEPLPTYKGVSQKNARELFRMTRRILSLPAEVFMKGFEDLAGAKTGLSEKKWRHYFQMVIVQEYQRRNNLYDDDAFAKLCERYRNKLKKWKEKRNSETTAQGNHEVSIKAPPKPVETVGSESVKPTDQQNQPTSLHCSNCFTRESYRWRKDIKGHLLCDACGRFLKLNGVMRPSATWTEPPNDDENADVDQQEHIANNARDSPRGQTFTTVLQKSTTLIDEPVQTGIQRQPEPNESRKRNTQSNSQSQTTSQSTASSGLVSDIPYRSEESLASIAEKALASIEAQVVHSGNKVQFEDTQSLPQKRYQSDSENQSVVSPKRRKVESAIPQSQRETSILSLSSNSSDGNEEDGIKQNLPSESDNEARLKPDEDLVTSRTKTSETLSLFLPEPTTDEEDDGPEDEDQSSQSVNQLPFIQLFNEETNEEHTEDHSSQYAPSEAPSEGVQFENTPILSQAWSTGPHLQEQDDDKGTDIADADALSEEDNDDREEDSRARSAVYSEQHHDSSVGSTEEYDEGVDFETAPEIVSAQTDPLPESHSTLERFDTAAEFIQDNHDQVLSEQADRNYLGKSAPGRLDTQALLQGDFHTDAEDTSFHLPPPEGGWDEDSDEIQITGENKHDSRNNTPFKIVKQEVADSQVQTKRRDTPEVVSDLSDSEDMENWLLTQQRIHAHHNIEPKIFGSICSRALESTCLEVSPATDVVASMVRKYIKGKYHNNFPSTPDVEGRSTPSSKAGRKLKRKEKAQLLESLVPENEKGVWTTLDDQWLTGTDARKVQKVEDKHGEAWIKKRFEYLENLYKP